MVVEGNNIATGIEIGTDGVLDADQLTVTATGLATDYGSVTGLKLGKNNHVDLGDNSRVTINGASDLAEGIYVMGPDATLIANNMDINISTTLDCRTGGVPRVASLLMGPDHALIWAADRPSQSPGSMMGLE